MEILKPYSINLRGIDSFICDSFFREGCSKNVLYDYYNVLINFNRSKSNFNFYHQHPKLYNKLKVIYYEKLPKI